MASTCTLMSTAPTNCKRTRGHTPSQAAVTCLLTEAVSPGMRTHTGERSAP